MAKKNQIKTEHFLKPQIFSDQDYDLSQLKHFKKISDFKNLGAESVRTFEKVGIMNGAQFVQLGWKKTWEKLALLNYKNTHTLFGYAIIGALENKSWLELTVEQKNEASEFAKKLRLKLKPKK